MRTDANHLPRVRDPAVQMLLSHAGQYDARSVVPVADPQLLTISRRRLLTGHRLYDPTLVDDVEEGRLAYAEKLFAEAYRRGVEGPPPGAPS